MGKLSVTVQHELPAGTVDNTAAGQLLVIYPPFTAEM